MGRCCLNDVMVRPSNRANERAWKAPKFLSYDYVTKPVLDVVTFIACNSVHNCGSDRSLMNYSSILFILGNESFLEKSFVCFRYFCSSRGIIPLWLKFYYYIFSVILKVSIPRMFEFRIFCNRRLGKCAFAMAYQKEHWLEILEWQKLWNIQLYED